MAPGSLIGFFLVFVVASWTLAIPAASTRRLMAGRLRAWGPAAEKRAAALTTLLPVALGALITFSIAIYSVMPGLFGGADHCNVHGHHLHLCLVHGGGWASEMWAVVACAALVALFLVRGAHLAATLAVGRSRVRIIERTSYAIAHHGLPVHIVPSHNDFCFATGYLSPRILVSSSLWQRLATEQRDAVIAHELTHNCQPRPVEVAAIVAERGLWGANFDEEVA